MKAFGSTSVESSVLAGWFRNRLSTSLTPHPVARGASLHGHYAASSLLPPPPTPGRAASTVMHSCHRRGERPQHAGPLRFLDHSVRPRRPPYPGESDDCMRLCLHHLCWLRRCPDGWPLSSWFFEAYA